MRFLLINTQQMRSYNMEILNAQFTATGSITALVDGVEMSIPADAANRHYAELLNQGIQIAAYVAPPITAEQVRAAIDAERDRRMNSVLFFAGNYYDCDVASLQRITGAGSLAGLAIAGGAKAGNVHWHGGADPFAWITADNIVVPMDAQTCFAFARAAAANISAHIFAAKALKSADPIPQDYTDGRYWP